jgi:hypothetical protein
MQLPSSRRSFLPPPPASELRPAVCYPDFLALDVIERLTPGKPALFSHRLQAKNGDGLFRTRAAFEARFDGRTLETAVSFRFAGQSLPYLVHALLIAGDETVYGCHDVTSIGTLPPARIFPGGTFAFPKCVLPSAPRPLDCRFLLWGSL